MFGVYAVNAFNSCELSNNVRSEVKTCYGRNGRAGHIYEKDDRRDERDRIMLQPPRDLTRQDENRQEITWRQAKRSERDVGYCVWNKLGYLDSVVRTDIMEG